MKPSQRSSSSTMCGSRSSGRAAALLGRGRRSRARRAAACRRRTSALSRPAAGRRARPRCAATTAPQCGSPASAQQRAVAAVEAVEVQVGRRAGAGQRAGHGAQRLRAAAARARRRRAGGRRSARSIAAVRCACWLRAGPATAYGDRRAAPGRARRCGGGSGRPAITVRAAPAATGCAARAGPAGRCASPIASTSTARSVAASSVVGRGPGPLRRRAAQLRPARPGAANGAATASAGSPPGGGRRPGRSGTAAATLCPSRT